MNFDSSVLQVAIEDIIPNRFQPRLNFEDSSLNELAASIKQHGIIQPLVLRRLGEKYEIIAGERRYRAARMAGLVSVPAVISKIDDRTSAEIAIVENVQRKELTAIEEAKSYKGLLDQGYMSQAQLAQKLGLPESAIENKMRLLTLTPEVQNAVMEGKISERHARSLLAVKDPIEQVKWLNKVIDERMTVRLLDTELRKEYGDKIMNEALNIEEVKQVATDIPVSEPVQGIAPVGDPMGFGPISIGQKPQGKFFNSLENEAVNMQTTETFNPFVQQNISEPAPVPSFNNIPSAVNENQMPAIDSTPSVVNIEPTPTQSLDIPQPVTMNNVVQPVQTGTSPVLDSLDTLDVTPISSVAPTKSVNEVKTKVASLIDQLRALGYNVNDSATELSDSITFTINVNLN